MTTREWVAVAVGVAVAAAIWEYAQGQGDDGGGIVADVAAPARGASSVILGALADFENVASQHNNPGGICGSFIGGLCQGPKTFDSLAEGTAAGIALIERKLIANPLITVADFVKQWSGASGQVLENYTNAVAGELGLSPDDPIADAGGDDDGTDDGSEP